MKHKVKGSLTLYFVIPLKLFSHMKQTAISNLTRNVLFVWLHLSGLPQYIASVSSYIRVQITAAAASSYGLHATSLCLLLMDGG
jgi:hypothetical protein